jgi:acyl dehydratase
VENSKDGWIGVINGRPTVGETATRSRITRREDIIKFTEITGDRNPVHYDEDLARRTPFGKLIVQGGVTSGLLNAVVAEDLPGPGTVFLAVEWKFVKAVGIDEEIIATVKVTSVRPDKPICVLETEIVNGDGEICLSGSATTYTMPLQNI